MRPFPNGSVRLQTLSPFLGRLFHALLDVTELGLSLAEDILRLAFCLQRLVAQQFACDFLDLAFRFFDAASNLVLIRAHDRLLITHFTTTLGPEYQSDP